MSNSDMWTEMPLHLVIYEWLVKNLNVPSDLGTLIAYLAFLMLVVYTIAWFIKMVVSIIWPLFLISTAIIAFHMLQNNNSEDISDILAKSFSVVTNTMAVTYENFIEYIQRVFNI